MNKIAIQGHPTRGKEIIQILESLGGKNINSYTGTSSLWYYINSYGNIVNGYQTVLISTGFKIYTLEEFEKEFPFKIGDKVKYITSIAIIKEYCYINNEPAYKVESIELGIIVTIVAKLLEPYKEMEIRHITLTLDKAKEWFKKDGDLKEVALQAYSEEELTKSELPKTWEEFCENYPVKGGECWIGAQCFINICKTDLNKRECRNWIPSKQSAEAHLALIQLEQLRDCYRQGDIPDFNDDNIKKYCIVKIKNDIYVKTTYNTSSFLTFTKKEIAEEFLNNFKSLIKIAENYI